MSNILILDIGKTNKKCFVFDEDYRIVLEKNTLLAETTDEDGEPCEDLTLLRNWVFESVLNVMNDERFQIRAINCTAYGASFVHLDTAGQPLTPLYNYLKHYPDALQEQFFNTYGAAEKIALETASPVLGSLNSGLQLYRLKYQKPLIFKAIKWSLHLPQYVSYLISLVVNSPGNSKSPGEFMTSEITSIGCHTMLWDFRKNDYHEWVKAEGIFEKFPTLAVSSGVFKSGPDHKRVKLGHGLHDSSAALIPYLACFEDPFVLISTGTWCIWLNPFNQESLTQEELSQDCLCYLSYEGKPVKAARYFGGHEYDLKLKALTLEYGAEAQRLFESSKLFESSELSKSLKTNFLEFMRQLVEKQVASTNLAIGNTSLQHIFVDGGFSKNETYMNLLAESFPKMKVFAAEVPHATAIGAAMAIHHSWNKKKLSKHLVLLKQIIV